ncbi:hypothetical protein ACFL6S_14250 [Candidatus Poribacteria bacterium]
MKKLVVGCIITFVGLIAFAGFIAELSKQFSWETVCEVIGASAIAIGGGFLVYSEIRYIRRSEPVGTSHSRTWKPKYRNGGAVNAILSRIDAILSRIPKKVYVVLLGMSLSFLYIRYDWKLPEVMRLSSIAIDASQEMLANHSLNNIASVAKERGKENHKEEYEEMQRAIIARIKASDDFYITTDNAKKNGINAMFIDAVTGERLAEGMRKALIEKEAVEVRAEQAAKSPLWAARPRRRYDIEKSTREALASHIEGDGLLFYQLRENCGLTSAKEMAEAILKRPEDRPAYINEIIQLQEDRGEEIFDLGGAGIRSYRSKTKLR